MRSPHARSRSRNLGRFTLAGFTLVELLVVIGIIGLMIGILLPALNKARESARQVQCLSNMRQLAMAFNAFVLDSKGWMPGRAGNTPTKFSSTGAVVAGTEADFKTPADWIAWRRMLDPVRGHQNTSGLDQNITFSAIAKYLGAKYVDHNPTNAYTIDAWRAANAVSPNIESLFVCPSDNRAQRSKTMLDNNGGRGNYPYSYSLNELFANPLIGIGTGSDGVSYPTNARFGGKPFNGRISSIKQQDQKVLLVCEDEQTIDDGAFRAAPGNWSTTTGQVNAVASRHMTRKMTAKNTALKDDVNRDARGNVGFVDGHVEFFNRKDALRARHSGRPDPDPAGF